MDTSQFKPKKTTTKKKQKKKTSVSRYINLLPIMEINVIKEVNRQSHMDRK